MAKTVSATKTSRTKTPATPRGTRAATSKAAKHAVPIKAPSRPKPTREDFDKALEAIYTPAVPKPINLGRLRRESATTERSADTGFVPSLVTVNLCLALALAAVVSIVTMDWHSGLFVIAGYVAGAIAWYDIAKQRGGRA